MYLYEVVLCSCSAPYYFKPYKCSYGDFIDGGIFDNNCFSSVIEIIKKNQGQKFNILSIGNIDSVKGYAKEIFTFKNIDTLINIILESNEEV